MELDAQQLESEGSECEKEQLTAAFNQLGAATVTLSHADSHDPCFQDVMGTSVRYVHPFGISLPRPQF
jgi:hypothetical protein